MGDAVWFTFIAEQLNQEGNHVSMSKLIKVEKQSADTYENKSSARFCFRPSRRARQRQRQAAAASLTAEAVKYVCAVLMVRLAARSEASRPQREAVELVNARKDKESLAASATHQTFVSRAQYLLHSSSIIRLKSPAMTRLKWEFVYTFAK